MVMVAATTTAFSQSTVISAVGMVKSDSAAITVANDQIHNSQLNQTAQPRGAQALDDIGPIQRHLSWLDSPQQPPKRGADFREVHLSSPTLLDLDCLPIDSKLTILRHYVRKLDMIGHEQPYELGAGCRSPSW